MLKNSFDKIAKIIFFISAVFSIIAVLTIAVFVLVNSIPAFKEIGFFNFLFGDVWNLSKNEFGIAPMIVGSIYITAGAILIGVFIGVFSAIFISKFAPKSIKRILKSSINLLSGIPSVVYGFFGMKFIVPLLSEMVGVNADGILSASIILGIMILPTVISISVNSLDAVPESYYAGAVALGASKEQAVFKVITPAAKSGIVTSIVLGIGRALGETMAVIMVAGNSPAFPDSIFSSLRTMTANVVLEMGYAENGSLHMSSIIATGAVLMVFVMMINVSISLFNNKTDRKGRRIKSFIAGKRIYEPPMFDDKLINYNANANENYALASVMPTVSMPSGMPVVGANAITLKPRSTVGIYKGLKFMSLLTTATAIASMLTIIIFIFVNGIPYITSDLLFNLNAEISLVPSLVSTLMLIAMSLLIALPLGISAAVFLNEYTKPDSKLVKIIRIATETLAGVPSIVFGLFGMLFFRYALGMGYSLIAGSLTLVLMILPTIIRTTEESLKCIPMSLREASLALGAGKTGTLFKVVLPCALSGIINAVILSIGRIVGESAALIFTAGSNGDMPSGYASSGSSLTVMLYVLSSEGLHVGEAFATAAVLIMLVVIINLISEIIDKKFSKKIGVYA